MLRHPCPCLQVDLADRMVQDASTQFAAMKSEAQSSSAVKLQEAAAQFDTLKSDAATHCLPDSLETSKRKFEVHVCLYGGWASTAHAVRIGFVEVPMQRFENGRYVMIQFPGWSPSQ